MTVRARLRVDPIACDGRGFCAEILPEMVTLDDWGFPIIRDADVPDALLSEAGEAVRLCPMLALRLDAVLAAHAGFCLSGTLAPAPPGLEPIIEAKAGLGRATIGWLARRVSGRSPARGPVTRTGRAGSPRPAAGRSRSSGCRR